MAIIEIILPLALLIGLGAGLARFRFLGPEVMADLNKLAFWVFLPAVLFMSSNRDMQPDSQMVRLLIVLFGATFIVSLLAWVAALLLKLPVNLRGPMIQAAFRGNLEQCKSQPRQARYQQRITKNGHQHASPLKRALPSRT